MNAVARDLKQVGNAIRRARKKKGLSQKDLASKVGIRQGTLSLIESGNSDSKMETVLAVLAALDLELQIAPRLKGWSQDMEGMF